MLSKLISLRNRKSAETTSFLLAKKITFPYHTYSFCLPRFLQLNIHYGNETTHTWYHIHWLYDYRIALASWYDIATFHYYNKYNWTIKRILANNTGGHILNVMKYVHSIYFRNCIYCAIRCGILQNLDLWYIHFICKRQRHALECPSLLLG